MENKNNVYLASKPRYEILDGLRGVAALTVVAYHLFQTYYNTCQAQQPINHGYLAVDFFFVLSGFVIGYAYDDRWDRMSTWNFFKRRLLRLHPMVIMGSIIGLLLFYFGACDMFPLVNETPWFKPLLFLIASCCMIPMPATIDIRGWNETYPLNGPLWSLMLEYCGNILYAFFFRYLPKAVLAIFVVLFAGLTVMLCMRVDPLGVLYTFPYTPEILTEELGEAAKSMSAEQISQMVEAYNIKSKAFTVMGGWTLNAQQMWIGFSRLLYPFFAGLLISRMGKFIKVKGGFWICSLLVFLCLALPRLDGGVNPDTYWMNGIYEAIVILLVFPVIVMMGAGSKMTDRRSAKVCDFLGRLSYPLYITHYPLLYIHMAWQEKNADLPLGTHIFVTVSLFILAIMIAYACLVLYDEPIRSYLKDKLFVKSKNG